MEWTTPICLLDTVHCGSRQCTVGECSPRHTSWMLVSFPSWTGLTALMGETAREASSSATLPSLLLSSRRYSWSGEPSRMATATLSLMLLLLVLVVAAPHNHPQVSVAFSLELAPFTSPW